MGRAHDGAGRVPRIGIVQATRSLMRSVTRAWPCVSIRARNMYMDGRRAHKHIGSLQLDGRRLAWLQLDDVLRVKADAPERFRGEYPHALLPGHMRRLAHEERSIFHTKVDKLLWVGEQCEWSLLDRGVLLWADGTVQAESRHLVGGTFGCSTTHHVSESVR